MASMLIDRIAFMCLGYVSWESLYSIADTSKNQDIGEAASLPMLYLHDDATQTPKLWAMRGIFPFLS